MAFRIESLPGSWIFWDMPYKCVGQTPEKERHPGPRYSLGFSVWRLRFGAPGFLGLGLKFYDLGFRVLGLLGFRI